MKGAPHCSRKSSSPLRSSRLSRWALFLVLICGPLAFSYSQDSSPSFDPKALYEVTGAELNSLTQDLQTAKNELTNLREENKKLRSESDELKKDSADKTKLLAELKTQLTTASELSKQSQSEALRNSIIAGGLGIAFGVVLTVATFLLN